MKWKATPPEEMPSKLIEDHLKWLAEKEVWVIDWSEAPIARWLKDHKSGLAKKRVNRKQK